MDNSHALLIGIANYQHINKLPMTVLKDVRDVYEILVNRHYCAYPAPNVHLLVDGEATQTAIRQALTDLAQRTNADSTVFIYISSHGGRIEAGPEIGEYLLPVDTELDISMSQPQILVKTAIAGAELTEALNTIPARKLVVVFDCCHSGGIGDVKNASAIALRSLPDSFYDELASGIGRVIIASSRSTESSYILVDAENSLFTQHLLAGLTGGVPSEDGFTYIFDLFEYIQPRVTGDHPRQHPIFKAEIEENFPIALHLGGEKGTIPGVEGDFLYDAYISYVDREPDSVWIWNTLVPRLENAGLRIAVSGDVADPGVYRVVNVERGIRQSKRTVIALSETYLADHMADFENVLAQTMGIEEGTYRLLPVKIAPIENVKLPTRLSLLTMLDLTHTYRAEREFERLVRALQGPLPHR